MRGDGTIDGNVTNIGLVAPGASSGILHIDGNYEQNAGGELLIELASASSYDQFQITDNATLDGTLTVNLINGFTPNAGQSFNILDWGSLAGTFSSLTLPSLAGLAWNTSQLSYRHLEYRLAPPRRLQPRRHRRRRRLRRLAQKPRGHLYAGRLQPLARPLRPDRWFRFRCYWLRQCSGRA